MVFCVFIYWQQKKMESIAISNLNQIEFSGLEELIERDFAIRFINSFQISTVKQLNFLSKDICLKKIFKYYGL